MTRKTAFVKISGDLIDRPDVLEWLRTLVHDHFVVICIGGGTQISKAFRARGYPVAFGALGRETRSFGQRQLARDVLEDNQEKIQELLARQGIPAVVVIPVIDIGSVLCHVNGDVYALAAYLGFDRVFVVTLDERRAKKEAELAKYPKIEVVSFAS